MLMNIEALKQRIIEEIHTDKNFREALKTVLFQDDKKNGGGN